MTEGIEYCPTCGTSVPVPKEDDGECASCGTTLPIYQPDSGLGAECADYYQEFVEDDGQMSDRDWALDDIDQNFSDPMEYEEQRAEIVNWLSASDFVVTSGRPAARSCYSCKSYNTAYEDGRWICASCGVTWLAHGPPRWNHFFVHGGIRARRRSGEIIDLVNWLVQNGIRGGDHINGWRVIQFYMGGRQMLVFCRVDGCAHDDGVDAFGADAGSAGGLPLQRMGETLRRMVKWWGD